jgi:hypothetical protein
MKPHVRWAAFAGILGAMLAGSSSAGAGEEKISVKELPRAVRKAVKAEFPKARIEQAAKEEEDGETIYEVTLKQGKRTIDVSLERDGEIVEIERTLTVDELPSAVKNALEARYPHAAIAKVETIRKGKDGPQRFEIAIVTEVVLDARGKAVKAGEDDEADEDDEHEARAKAKKSSKHEDGDDDEDEDDEHHARAKAKKSSKHEDGDDDDDDDEHHAKGKAKKSSKHDGDDDDDEHHAKAKKSSKHETGDDEDEDDDEHHAKAKAKKSSKHEDRDDDDDDDDEDEDEDKGHERGRRD